MNKAEHRRNANSCWSKARENEYLFILLGRDAAVPATIRYWASQRIALGKNTADDPQIHEALLLADQIERSQK